MRQSRADCCLQMSSVSYGHPVIDKRGAANGQQQLVDPAHGSRSAPPPFAHTLLASICRMTNISNDFNTFAAFGRRWRAVDLRFIAANKLNGDPPRRPNYLRR